MITSPSATCGSLSERYLPRDIDPAPCEERVYTPYCHCCPGKGHDGADALREGVCEGGGEGRRGSANGGALRGKRTVKAGDRRRPWIAGGGGFGGGGGKGVARCE